MLQVATGGLTLCPQFIVQALQGVGRVPFLQGEPSKHSASHRELHLSTVTHPILYLKQKSLSLFPSRTLSLLPPSLLAHDVNVYQLRLAECLRMNGWKRERAASVSKRGWGEWERKGEV